MPTPAKPVRVEVTVDSLEGALVAVAGGADRLELCADLEAGGLTPSAGLVAAVRAAVSLPLFAMVRPRGGDFVCSDAERDVMRRDIAALRAAGVDGIVTGALLPDGRIAADVVRELLAVTRPLPLTFHRAFDVAAEPHAALATLLDLGVDRLLTSGQAPNAPAGAPLLADLVRTAAGRLVVMAGCGVRHDNVAALVAATGVTEVHLSASTWREGPMTFRRPDVPMGSSPRGDHARRVTDGVEVAKVVAALRVR